MSDDEPRNEANDGGTGIISQSDAWSPVRSILGLSDVQATAQDYAEVGLDALLDNDAIDALPVLGTIRALVRGASGFREAWLTKKLVSLIYGLGPATAEDTQAWRARISSDKSAADAGERVLAIIDRVTSRTKATLIGQALREYLDGGCDRRTFLRASEMIDAALNEDLDYLLHDWSEGVDDDACKRLIAVGLLRDRRSNLEDEGSKPPDASTEGRLLRSTSRSTEAEP